MKRVDYRIAVRGGLLLVGGLIFAALPPRHGLASPREGFAELEAEIDAVEEDSAGREILKKMDVLVEATWGKTDGAYIAIETLRWSAYFDREGVFGRFKKVVGQYPDAPEFIEAFEELEYVHGDSGSPKEWTSLLNRLAQSSKLEEMPSHAVHMRGVVELHAGQLEKARETFNRVIALSPGSDRARSAERYIFEIDNLQVGMVAPDFTAKRLDGTEVSLKSLRGKTVLLNFWATW